MMLVTRSGRGLLAAFGTIAMMWALPANAVFLGMDIGDKIDGVGLNIPVGGAAFVGSGGSGTLDVTATATDITTTLDSPGGQEVLVEISGGAVEINLDLQSETLERITAGSIALYHLHGDFQRSRRRG